MNLRHTKHGAIFGPPCISDTWDIITVNVYHTTNNSQRK